MWIRNETYSLINVDNGNRIILQRDEHGDFPMYRVILFVAVRISLSEEKYNDDDFDAMGLEYYDGKPVQGYELFCLPMYEKVVDYFNKLALKLGAEEI